MPYLRCASCGVLTYVCPREWRPPCVGCGLPLGGRERDRLGPNHRYGRLDELLRMTRELLDADLAVVSRIADGCESVYRADGDWPEFNRGAVTPLPLEETICQQMLEGRIGHYVNDTRSDMQLRGLRAVQELGIGAWMGVPIALSDVELYVLCCLARETRPSVGEPEVKLLLGLAESVRVELADHPSGGGTHRAPGVGSG